jgi:hypothetical protein
MLPDDISSNDGVCLGGAVTEIAPPEEEVMAKPCFFVASCRRERRTRQVKMVCNTRSTLEVRGKWC